jgi:hypothetical protein
MTWKFKVGDVIEDKADSAIYGRVVRIVSKPKKRYLVFTEGQAGFSENLYFPKGKTEREYVKSNLKRVA